MFVDEGVLRGILSLIRLSDDCSNEGEDEEEDIDSAGRLMPLLTSTLPTEFFALEDIVDGNADDIVGEGGEEGEEEEDEVNVGTGGRGDDTGRPDDGDRLMFDDNVGDDGAEMVMVYQFGGGI
jgi:hypothetical protein